MFNANFAYDYTARIRDRDTGVLIIPDLECRLSASVVNGGRVKVDAVWLEDADNRKNYIDADASKDHWVVELAAEIRSQAQSDEEFCDRVREDQGFEYPEDDYVSQHRLRACDVLPNHSF